MFSNALAGIVYFHYMRESAPYKLALFGVGGLICISGVAILLLKKKSQPHVDAGEAAGKEEGKEAGLLLDKAGDEGTAAAEARKGEQQPILFSQKLRSISRGSSSAAVLAEAKLDENVELVASTGFQGSAAGAATAAAIVAAGSHTAWYHLEVKDILAAAWAGVSARGGRGAGKRGPSPTVGVAHSYEEISDDGKATA